MSKTKILLLLAIAVLSAAQVRAQSTNMLPATALEMAETIPGSLVLKSSISIGSMDAQPFVIQVTCKQDDIINPVKNTTWSTQYGCSLAVTAKGQTMSKTLIDADEMDSLLQAIAYIRGVNWSMVSLPAFDLSYTTKAGLTVSGFSSKRNGTIEFSLKTSTLPKSLLFSQDQVNQLYTLLQNTKSKIDSLRKG